jgi:serine protease Do
MREKLTVSNNTAPWSRLTRRFLSLLLLAVVAGYASPASAAHPGTDAAKKPKNTADHILAIYVPEAESDSRIFIQQLDASFAPGKALEQAAVDVGKIYFKAAALFDGQSNAPFNVLLALHAKWESKDRESTLTVKYKLFDAAGAILLEGEKKNDISSQKLLVDNAFYSVSLGLMRDILAADDLQGKFADSHADAASTAAAAFDRTLLVSREKPAKSGTGFIINGRGQIMTAAHVVHGCPVVEVKVDGKSVDAHLVAESALLDLAIVDSGHPSDHIIPLRIGTSFDLGEAVTNVGFPLDGVLAGSPNVTRGNVSSRAALAGSLGQFQFSAPIQPGSSGGPVVSDSGELLGVTVATLSVAGLIQRGILPQNINFALDARYAAKFMDRNKVSYLSVAPNHKPDAHGATEAALAAVAQLICYQ